MVSSRFNSDLGEIGLAGKPGLAGDETGTERIAGRNAITCIAI
jgi:hypothetical protein